MTSQPKFRVSVQHGASEVYSQTFDDLDIGLLVWWLNKRSKEPSQWEDDYHALFPPETKLEPDEDDEMSLIPKPVIYWKRTHPVEDFERKGSTIFSTPFRDALGEVNFTGTHWEMNEDTLNQVRIYDADERENGESNVKRPDGFHYYLGLPVHTKTDYVKAMCYGDVVLRRLNEPDIMFKFQTPDRDVEPDVEPDVVRWWSQEKHERKDHVTRVMTAKAFSIPFYTILDSAKRDRLKPKRWIMNPWTQTEVKINADPSDLTSIHHSGEVKFIGLSMSSTVFQVDNTYCDDGEVILMCEGGEMVRFKFELIQ